MDIMEVYRAGVNLIFMSGESGNGPILVFGCQREMLKEAGFHIIVFMVVKILLVLKNMG